LSSIVWGKHDKDESPQMLLFVDDITNDDTSGLIPFDGLVEVGSAYFDVVEQIK